MRTCRTYIRGSQIAALWEANSHAEEDSEICKQPSIRSTCPGLVAHEALLARQGTLLYLVRNSLIEILCNCAFHDESRILGKG